LLHTIAIVATICAIGVLAGITYHTSATARDNKRYPAPGRYIQLGTHRAHLLEMGEGSPTIVLESGLMATVLTWHKIQPQLAKTARVVSYDRAGLGWSDRGREPRNAERIVSELHELLRRAQMPPPYLLVGHSFGGLTMPLFAAQYLEEVAGLVLIDPVVPQEWNPPAERDRTRIKIGARVCRRAAVLSQLGVIRIVSVLVRSGATSVGGRLIRLISRGAPADSNSTSSPWFWNLPTGERAMAPVTWVRAKFCHTIASQLERLPESAAQAAGVTRLEGKPLVVISAGNTPALRLSEHRAMARRLSSQGKHVLADQSSHWITEDQPDVVVRAILEISGLERKASIAKVAN
jgi:pimeloyl-ACP methyl ester carboxylesterase